MYGWLIEVIRLGGWGGGVGKLELHNISKSFNRLNVEFRLRNFIFC